MWKEFKEFAFKGNVIDLAVAVIIGGAFGKIITSLVSDIVMPIVGVMIADTDFSKLKYVLSPAELDSVGKVVKAEAAIHYGSFIQASVDFIIIAFFIFLFVKFANNLNKEKEESVEEVPKPTTEELLTQIVDLLKNKK